MDIKYADSLCVITVFVYSKNIFIILRTTYISRIIHNICPFQSIQGFFTFTRSNKIMYILPRFKIYNVYDVFQFNFLVIIQNNQISGQLVNNILANAMYVTLIIQWEGVKKNSTFQVKCTLSGGGVDPPPTKKRILFRHNFIKTIFLSSKKSSFFY